MTTDAQALEAFDSIERELDATPKALNVNLCEQYQRIKKLIDLVLPLIERIPVYGSKIALVVRFLMKLADVACPA